MQAGPGDDGATPGGAIHERDPRQRRIAIASASSSLATAVKSRPLASAASSMACTRLSGRRRLFCMVGIRSSISQCMITAYIDRRRSQLPSPAHRRASSPTHLAVADDSGRSHHDRRAFHFRPGWARLRWGGVHSPRLPSRPRHFGSGPDLRRIHSRALDHPRRSRRSLGDLSSTLAGLGLSPPTRATLG